MDKSNQIKFFVKSCIIFTVLSFGFSLTGFLFPDESHIIGNPITVGNPSFEHIFGHILFGMIAGAISLSLRYVFLTGAFAILLDADHLLQFLDIEMISRMVHSMPFAIIIALIMLYVFGKRDYRLAAISFSAIISHIAFDIWFGGQLYPGSSAGFPLFSPFTFETVSFQGVDWLGVQIIGVTIVVVVSYFYKRKEIKLKNNLTKT